MALSKPLPFIQKLNFQAVCFFDIFKQALAKSKEKMVSRPNNTDVLAAVPNYTQFKNFGHTDILQEKFSRELRTFLGLVMLPDYQPDYQRNTLIKIE